MRSVRGSSERRYLRLPWGQVHLRSAGRPVAPTVLMVHQSPLSSATYEAVLEPLAQRGIRAIAVDTPGFGMSDAPPQAWSVADYARALWQVADLLALQRLVLLGQHTGAVIACEAARQRGARVAGLVLQGLPLYEQAERREKLATYAPAYEPDPDGGHLRVIWDRIHMLYPDIPVDSADRQVIEYLCVGPDYAPAYRAVFDHVVDTGALVSTPIALVHGDRDLVHRMTSKVQAALPHATLRLIANGTDFVPEERPEEFAAAVAAHVHDWTATGNPKRGNDVSRRDA